MIVRDLTDEYWELQRHKNFKPLLIEQAYERQVKRATEQVESDFCAKAHALRASLTRAAKPASAGAHKDTSAQQDEEHAAAKRKEKIEADIESLAHATAEKLELLQRPATDADYAGNLEHWIYPYERVDQLQLAAQKRLNAVRQDLECYRDGLARQLRDHDVVDGEFEEAPPRPLQGQAQPASPSNTVITVTSASGKEGTGAPVKPVTPRTTALMPPEPAPVQLDEMPAASNSRPRNARTCRGPRVPPRTRFPAGRPWSRSRTMTTASDPTMARRMWFDRIRSVRSRCWRPLPQPRSRRARRSTASARLRRSRCCAQLPRPRRSALAPWAKTILCRGRSNAPQRHGPMALRAPSVSLRGVPLHFRSSRYSLPR